MSVPFLSPVRFQDNTDQDTAFEIMPSVMINPTSDEALGTPIGAQAWAALASAAWPTAGLTFLYPFSLTRSRLLVKGWWLNGATITAATTVSFAIYDEAMTTRIVSGTATQATASVIQEVDITDTLLLAGVQYYAALAADKTSTFNRLTGIGTAPVPLNNMKSLGITQMATAIPTPGVPVALAQPFLPYFGLSFRTLVA